MPNDPAKLPVLYRSGILEIETRAEGDAGDRKVHRFSVSSETPVERWFGIEVLSHAKNAIDRTYLRNGLPVLADDKIGGHNGVQVGIFENDSLEDGKLRGDVRFSISAKAQEVEQDVEDKIRKQVSIGYRIRKFTVAKGNGNAPDIYTATRWVPMEVTILPLGADVSVGPGRSGDREFDVEIERAADAGLEEEVDTMPDPKRGTQTPSSEPAPTPAPASPERGTPPVVQVEPRHGERNLGREAGDIVDLAQANGLGERAAGWIREGLSPDQVAREILKIRATQGPGQPAAESIPVSPKDARRYSYHRAMRLAAFGSPETFDGLEGEVHGELRRNLPEGVKYNGGILVPMRLRALDSATSGAGSELVPTEQAELIEILRNRARVVAMGARLLTGLQGPISFPKQIGAISVQWVGENPGADVGDTDIALGQLLLGPKTLQGSTAYSRQLLSQSSVDVEMMVRDDLGAGHGLAVDLGALHGSGAAGQPTGIYNAPDVQAQAFGGVPTYALVVAMQGKVADANAEMGRLGYLTNPLTAALCKVTPEHATAQMASWLWQGPIADGMMAGYRATSTKQASGTLAGGAEQAIVYGNWGDLMVGLWNAMELVVDPYSKKKQALVEVTSFQMADVGIRHGESFCKATGATLS